MLYDNDNDRVSLCLSEGKHEALHKENIIQVRTGILQVGR